MRLQAGIESRQIAVDAMRPCYTVRYGDVADFATTRLGDSLI